MIHGIPAVAAGLAVASLFVVADPIVAAICGESGAAPCSGMGGRFALVTLLRAAIGLPILALLWRPPAAPAGMSGRRRTAVLLSLVALMLITARVYEAAVGGAEEFAVAVWRTAHPTWLLVVALVVAAPVFEEALFRGLLFDRMSRTPWLAVGGSAIVWSAVHTQYDLGGAVLLAWLGVLLGCARLASGGLLLPMAMHAAWNLRALIVVHAP